MAFKATAAVASRLGVPLATVAVAVLGRRSGQRGDHWARPTGSESAAGPRLSGLTLRRVGCADFDERKAIVAIAGRRQIDDEPGLVVVVA
jgi:hypothetical protein